MKNLELSLCHDYGNVYVKARTDPDEQWWYLLRFNPEGTITRVTGVSTSIGMVIDDAHQLDYLGRGIVSIKEN